MSAAATVTPSAYAAEDVTGNHNLLYQDSENIFYPLRQFYSVGAAYSNGNTSSVTERNDAFLTTANTRRSVHRGRINRLTGISNVYSVVADPYSTHNSAQLSRNFSVRTPSVRLESVDFTPSQSNARCATLQHHAVMNRNVSANTLSSSRPFSSALRRQNLTVAPTSGTPISGITHFRSVQDIQPLYFHCNSFPHTLFQSENQQPVSNLRSNSWESEQPASTRATLLTRTTSHNENLNNGIVCLTEPSFSSRNSTEVNERRTYGEAVVASPDAGAVARNTNAEAVARNTNSEAVARNTNSEAVARNTNAEAVMASPYIALVDDAEITNVGREFPITSVEFSDPSSSNLVSFQSYGNMNQVAAQPRYLCRGSTYNTAESRILMVDPSQTLQNSLSFEDGNLQHHASDTTINNGDRGLSPVNSFRNIGRTTSINTPTTAEPQNSIPRTRNCIIRRTSLCPNVLRMQSTALAPTRTSAPPLTTRYFLVAESVETSNVGEDRNVLIQPSNRNDSRYAGSRISAARIPTNSVQYLSRSPTTMMTVADDYVPVYSAGYGSNAFPSGASNVIPRGNRTTFNHLTRFTSNEALIGEDGQFLELNEATEGNSRRSVSRAPTGLVFVRNLRPRSRRTGLESDDLEQLEYGSLLEVQGAVGYVSRGVPFSLIRRFPEEKFDARRVRNEEQRECNICQMDYEEADMLRRLPCWHAFHSACIDKWLENRKTCPLCRFEVDQGLEFEASERNYSFVPFVEANRSRLNLNENIHSMDLLRSSSSSISSSTSSVSSSLSSFNAANWLRHIANAIFRYSTQSNNVSEPNRHVETPIQVGNALMQLREFDSNPEIVTSVSTQEAASRGNIAVDRSATSENNENSTLDVINCQLRRPIENPSSQSSLPQEVNAAEVGNNVNENNIGDILCPSASFSNINESNSLNGSILIDKKDNNSATKDNTIA